jgi:ribosome biogenesis GTPase
VYGSTCAVAVGDRELLVHASGCAPIVGDFVECDGERIRGILPRHSQVARIAPGGSHDVQVLAANLDLLFIVIGLDRDFNLRRIERYLVLAVESGVEPVIVLNKADLCVDRDKRAEEVRRVAPQRTVIVSSAVDRSGVDEIRNLITENKSSALIGSSGAGKSTLMNLLLGEERQTVRSVRESDHRGRHTTTRRQMFRIPGGGWLMDQPGLREIQILAGEEAVDEAFPDVTDLASECRFRDCRHENEPGCAVREAIDPARLKSFAKLRREAQRANEEFDLEANRKRKSFCKQMERAMRLKKKLDG